SSGAHQDLPSFPTRRSSDLESLIFMLEFADIIVINKTDLIDESTLETISAHIQTLNRSAQLLPATYGAIEPGKILPHKVFDFDQDRKSTRLNSSHVKISYAV